MATQGLLAAGTLLGGSIGRGVFRTCSNGYVIVGHGLLNLISSVCEVAQPAVNSGVRGEEARKQSRYFAGFPFRNCWRPTALLRSAALVDTLGDAPCPPAWGLEGDKIGSDREQFSSSREDGPGNPCANRTPHSPQLTNRLLAVLLAIGVTTGLVKAGGGGDVTLEVISAWGGPVNTVDIQGKLAYIGTGRRMVILNIDGFEKINEIGSIDLLSTVEDLVVRDGFAYVATKQEIFGYGFCSVNVSDPSNPTLASNPDAFGNFQPRLVELYRNIAYVSEGSSTEAFDITDPENVIDLGSIIVLPHKAFTIKGDLLYTADKHPTTELAIYDLTTDPLNPALLGEWDFGPEFNVEALHIAVDQDIACLLVHDVQGDYGSDFLAVIDVSSTSSPVLLGTYALASHITDAGVDVVGGLAYVADRTNGLIILDITTDPSNPTIVGSFDTHGFARRISVIGERAYLSDDGEGLIILDVSDPTEPVRLGGYYSPTELRKMKKIGDLLYVSDAWNGFTVLDVSDPHSIPIVVGIYQTPDSHSSITLQGNWGIDVRNGLAYLSEGRNGFEVVDVSDPQNPVSVGALEPWPDGVTAMDLKLNPLMEPPFTNILHVSTMPGAWLINFDVSNPSNIAEIGSALLGGDNCSPPFVYDVELTPDGEFAHIAKCGAVKVVDVSDPKAPEVIHTGGPIRVLDLALDGDIRYLANSELSGCDNNGALHIQDVFDPANPSDLVMVDWCYGDLGIRRLSAVTVSNDRAYVVANFSPPDTGAASTFVVAFDVTDPSAPVLLDFVKAGHWQRTALLVDDPYLFVTTDPGSVRSEGLVIIEVIVAGECPWDLDDSGDVGVKDLLFLLGAWGPCPKKGDCLADFDDSGDVGVKDLLILLGAWGPCPPKGDCPADFDASNDVGVKDLLILQGAWGPCP